MGGAQEVTCHTDKQPVTADEGSDMLESLQQTPEAEAPEPTSTVQGIAEFSWTAQQS